VQHTGLNLRNAIFFLAVLVLSGGPLSRTSRHPQTQALASCAATLACARRRPAQLLRTFPFIAFLPPFTNFRIPGPPRNLLAPSAALPPAPKTPSVPTSLDHLCIPSRVCLAPMKRFRPDYPSPRKLPVALTLSAFPPTTACLCEQLSSVCSREPITERAKCDRDQCKRSNLASEAINAFKLPIFRAPAVPLLNWH